MKFGWTVVAVAALSAFAQGYSIDQADLEYSAGSGNSRSVMVLDFGAGGTHAFGYSWDGSATSWDMLKAVCEASGSTVTVAGGTITGVGGTMEITGTDYSWGKIIESIRYAGQELVDDYYGTGESIRFWISGHPEYVEILYDENWNPTGSVVHPETSGDGQTWTSPPFGITARELADGYWDGYTQADSAGTALEPVVPLGQADEPEIPEPATMTMVVLACAALAGRRRRFA